MILETTVPDRSSPGELTVNNPMVQPALEYLGLSSTEGCRWDAVAKGGSGREFYRLRPPDGASLVVMRYSNDREDNAFYPAIAGFLKEIHLNVPRILFQDSLNHLIGLEDLGDRSLYQVVQEESSPEEIIHWYSLALEQVEILHRYSESPVPTMPGFDEKLYHWERSYFFENLVGRWAGLTLSSSESRSLEKEGEDMARELLRAPRRLIHRDFQSQNILIHKNQPWLIDFQGMRPGHAAYDLASLLYDPYVKLGPSLRTAILKEYLKTSSVERRAFLDQFHRAAVQRLMQALGAYGFLGLVKGKPEFLRFIPQGLENLADALKHLDGMREMSALVERLRVSSFHVSSCL